MVAVVVVHPPPHLHVDVLLAQLPPRLTDQIVCNSWNAVFISELILDNSVATMWPCLKATKLFVIAILLYMLLLSHLDTET